MLFQCLNLGKFSEYKRISAIHFQHTYRQSSKVNYNVYISNLAIGEINNCSQSKKNILYDYLSQISFNSVTSSDEAIEIAHQIIKQGILNQKSFDDCLYLGMAVSNECDIVVSWDFKHMINIKTIHGVRSISIANGCKMIDIYHPTHYKLIQ